MMTTLIPIYNPNVYNKNHLGKYEFVISNAIRLEYKETNLAKTVVCNMQ